MSEMQRVMLGQIFHDPDTWHRAGLVSEHFTDGFCRMVYEAIGQVMEAGEPLSLLTVKQRVPDIDAARLAQLTDAPRGNWSFYADRVKEEARRYWLRRLMAEAVEQIDRGDGTDQVYGYVEDGLVKIALAGKEDVRLMAEGLKGYIEELEDRHNHPGQLPGITTGFEAFDLVFGGFERQKLYYIGARPSQGKSALLLNFLAHAARAGAKCGLLSLESSEREAYARLFAQTQNIENGKLRLGYFRDADMKRIVDAATEIYDWPVWISDNPELTVSEVKTVCRKMVIAHGVEILYVDYLQYIREDEDGVERRDHVAATSRALKAIARQLNVPVVCAAQLRRDADGRRPMLGDFAESSQVEKDADVAILLHEWVDAGIEYHQVCVEKNRDGRTLDIPVVFDKEFARFRCEKNFENRQIGG